MAHIKRDKEKLLNIGLNDVRSLPAETPCFDQRRGRATILPSPSGLGKQSI
jgi:hypothetical protein